MVRRNVNLIMSIINLFKKKKIKDNFNKIYEKYYETTLKRIAYFLNDVHAAEDLTQEVFIKLYNSPPEHDNIGAWLNKVSANISYNYLRDKKIHAGKNEILYENELDQVVSIEEIALQNYEIEITRKALNMLSPRDRMSLLLKFSGYKYCEIAEVIGVDVNSIGTIISRAQKKFKEHYILELEHNTKSIS